MAANIPDEPNELDPENDLIRTFVLTDFDNSYSEVPATTGTVTMMITTAKDTDAPAHASLVVAAAYVGGTGSPVHPAGTWGATIDASVLTYTLLDGIFATAVNGVIPKPWLIVKRDGAVRVVEQLKYSRARFASIENADDE